jgi:hypothetical protein
MENIQDRVAINFEGMNDLWSCTRSIVGIVPVICVFEILAAGVLAGMEELKAKVPPHWLASVFGQHTRGEGVEHLRTYLT